MDNQLGGCSPGKTISPAGTQQSPVVCNSFSRVGPPERSAFHVSLSMVSLFRSCLVSLFFVWVLNECLKSQLQGELGTSTL